MHQNTQLNNTWIQQIWQIQRSIAPTIQVLNIAKYRELSWSHAQYVYTAPSQISRQTYAGITFEHSISS